jgi:hypothetical protein
VTFIPQIQTFNGAHATHSGSTGQNSACDFRNDQLWMSDSTNITRYKISDGTEQAFALSSTVPSFNPGILGWANDGNIYAPQSLTLNHGGLAQIDGASLALLGSCAFPNPFFTSGAIVSSGGTPVMACGNPGNPIITSNNNTDYVNGTTFITNLGWGVNYHGVVCPGKNGSNVSWLITSPNDNALPQVVTVQSVDLFGNPTTVGTIVSTDIDPSWIHINIAAVCMDQTDGNPIGIFTGGALPKLAKISRIDGSLVWVAGVPVVADSAGQQFAQSRINNSRLAILNKLPNGVVIYNTTDGSTVDAYFTGMDGINIIGPQCYDDTIGAIILACTYSTTVGGPVPLNGSTTGFTGWAALYVADGITPPPPPSGRRHSGFIGLSKANNPLVYTLRITEAGDIRVTMAGDNRKISGA